MKFPVGTKVVIKSASMTWSGLRAVVQDADPDEKTYPYTLTLLDPTRTGTYQPGDVAAAFREDELLSLADVVARDLEAAKALLQKHGLAFRIYSREDVDKMLDAYGEDENEPLDTKTFREELVEFIMGGKDWADLSRKGFDDETTLWNLVEGARNDHPEWFVG